CKLFVQLFIFIDLVPGPSKVVNQLIGHRLRSSGDVLSNLLFDFREFVWQEEPGLSESGDRRFLRKNIKHGDDVGRKKIDRLRHPTEKWLSRVDFQLLKRKAEIRIRALPFFGRLD